MVRLFHPVDSVSVKDKNHKDGSSPIRNRLSQASMRAIGVAFDKGIIKPAKEDK